MDLQRCCSLQLGKELQKKDYGFFVRLLLDSGIKADEIQQIDLKGRRGFCKLTLATPAALQRLVSQDVVVNGTHLVFLIGDGSVTSLQVFGVDEDLPLSAITKALQDFGFVLGEPRREAKTVEGCTFRTGTVFVQLVQTAAIPSNIQVPDRTQKLRTWHKGQVQTCYTCNEASHEAKDCPKRKQSYASKVKASTLGAGLAGAVDELLRGTRNAADHKEGAARPLVREECRAHPVELNLPNTESDTKASSKDATESVPEVMPIPESDNKTRRKDDTCRVSRSASVECMPSVSASASIESLSMTGAEDEDDPDHEKWQTYSGKRGHRTVTSSTETSPANGQVKKPRLQTQ